MEGDEEISAQTESKFCACIVSASKPTTTEDMESVKQFVEQAYANKPGVIDERVKYTRVFCDTTYFFFTAVLQIIQQKNQARAFYGMNKDGKKTSLEDGIL